MARVCSFVTFALRTWPPSSPALVPRMRFMPVSQAPWATFMREWLAADGLCYVSTPCTPLIIACGLTSSLRPPLVPLQTLSLLMAETWKALLAASVMHTRRCCRVRLLHGNAIGGYVYKGEDGMRLPAGAGSVHCLVRCPRTTVGTCCACT